MKKFCKSFVVVLAALLVVQPMLAVAASPARIIPTGNVSLLADGKEMSQFRSEMPLPQGALMACNGNCLVQTQSLQLVAADKTVFALAESQKEWDLTVKSGQVDFAIAAQAKPMAFHTPHDIITAEQAIIPASSDGLVRGYVSVTENGTELTVQEGALQVMSSDGRQLVQAGHSVVLAQAKVGKTEKAAAAGAAASAGAGAGIAAGSGGISSSTALAAGGIVAAGIAGGVIATGSTGPIKAGTYADVESPF